TGLSFEPLMTLYLTESLSVTEIEKAALDPHIHGVKLYPAGATTNSDSGVRDVQAVLPVLEKMEELGLPLLVHGEVTNPEVDVFDRESVFIEKTLNGLITRFPKLKLVLEHITTKEGVDWVLAQTENVGGTITPQHLLLNRNALFQGGMRPHHYCLPVLKREVHREALVKAATSGNSRFFLGTDSAPHAQSRKENACGCAGIFSAHAAIELYAEAFEQANALDRLEGFASLHGPQFYGLPVNKEKITLNKRDWTVDSSYPFGDDRLVPFRAGETIHWKLE
ncbi:MAG: dihydroorotase, partial [Gammaproteobacteria bacterium]|nr:dihydroorotase [Gammaproteobacteria bacterium]